MERVIQTAVPFLLISPDARATGLDDTGVAAMGYSASTHHISSLGKILAVTILFKRPLGLV